MGQERIGLVGPGRMGLAMVRHLVRHGYPVTVTDVEPEASEPALRALELRLVTRLSNRSYTYGAASNGLSDQGFGLTASALLEARWYPAARLSSGLLANLGLDLQGAWMLPAALSWGSSTFKSTSFSFGAAVVCAFNQSKTFVASKVHFSGTPFRSAFRFAAATASALWSSPCTRLAPAFAACSENPPRKQNASSTFASFANRATNW